MKGLLRITDVTDPSVLQPLVGLRRANLLQIYDNPGLDVSRNAALIDVSALVRVRCARFVEFHDLPITAP